MPNKPGSRLDTGRKGELAAEKLLQEKGYRIAERNYRFGRAEIDLIAWSPENILVFVEVKTRSSDTFGGPEGAVDQRKRTLLNRAAGAYMESIAYEWELRFDVIAVVVQGERIAEIRHLEDAFF